MCLLELPFQGEQSMPYVLRVYITHAFFFFFTKIKLYVEVDSRDSHSLCTIQGRGSTKTVLCTKPSPDDCFSICKWNLAPWRGSPLWTSPHCWLVCLSVSLPFTHVHHHLDLCGWCTQESSFTFLALLNVKDLSPLFFLNKPTQPHKCRSHASPCTLSSPGTKAILQKCRTFIVFWINSCLSMSSHTYVPTTASLLNLREMIGFFTLLFYSSLSQPGLNFFPNQNKPRHPSGTVLIRKFYLIFFFFARKSKLLMYLFLLNIADL